MTGLATRMWDERGEPRDEVMLRTRATDGAGRPLVVTVVNLSPGGMMARSEAMLAAGDVLSVDLPTLGRVEVEVRWSLGGRIGCRFEPAVLAERYESLLAAMRAR